jgi:hypothetical protein
MVTAPARSVRRRRAGPANLGRDGCEGSAELRSEGRDDRDENRDDEGDEYAVLDGGRTLFIEAEPGDLVLNCLLDHE